MWLLHAQKSLFFSLNCRWVQNVCFCYLWSWKIICLWRSRKQTKIWWTISKQQIYFHSISRESFQLVYMSLFLLYEELWEYHWEYHCCWPVVIAFSICVSLPAPQRTTIRYVFLAPNDSLFLYFSSLYTLWK